jgi:hypothetical protein
VGGQHPGLLRETAARIGGTREGKKTGVLHLYPKALGTPRERGVRRFRFFEGEEHLVAGDRLVVELECLQASSQISFVGRGFSRDIERPETLGFSP